MDDASAKADFRFDQRDGVLLKPDASDPTHQFYEQGPHGGGKQFHWIDKNSYKAMFEYEINVYKGNPHSGIKCKKDRGSGTAERDEVRHGENANASECCSVCSIRGIWNN
jgi:hypothetical protein